jgi:hypothetical protein
MLVADTLSPIQSQFRAVFGVDLRADLFERSAQIGRLCGLCAAMLRSQHPLVGLLRRAEYDEAALEQALDIVSRLPALLRRRIIATFGACQWAQPRD